MATSLKGYLKKYQLTGDEDKRPKKRKVATKVPGGLTVVDNDAAWHKKNIDEDSDEPEVEGDEPQVIEDVEVKRMHQMERVKQHRPYMSIGDDGSGWSTIDRKSKDGPLDAFPSGRIPPEDTSPPRKRKPQTDFLDMSPPRRKSSRAVPTDTSRPMKMNDGRQAGLITNKELAAELAAEPLKKKPERLRNTEGGGRAVETINCDKRGKRLESLEEQHGEVRPLEWGKGLAQKREVEEQLAEFEAEKVKPFARTRDDPELDKMYKERVRWGDPMARLVKRKDPATELVDSKTSEEMKEFGFILPQRSQRSWLELGVVAPMNRYGIKPGRHWDGKDRSTGFESQMFKAKAEK